MLRYPAALLVLAVLALAPFAAEAQGWRTYVNPRFGTTAEVPRDWRPGRPPDNNDGLAFVSPDSLSTITVSGGFQVLDTIAEALRLRAEPNEGERITYRHQTARSIVVSGLRGEHIFYRKSILSCRDTIWNSVSIEYPAARKQAFDALATRVANSLRQGRGEQTTECQ